MKKRNYWVSIADLLSGVVLILLLMFVLASILPQYTQEANRREMMEKIDAALIEYINSGQIKVDVESGILEFTAITFPSGSAQLTPATIAAVKDFSSQLKEYMTMNQEMEILIEGHTDPAAVNQVVNSGGYFDNNVQLSTLRAANFRTELLKNIGQEYADKIGVAGYGETRLKNKNNPLSEENRRIEIRILWNSKADK